MSINICLAQTADELDFILKKVNEPVKVVSLDLSVFLYCVENKIDYYDPINLINESSLKMSKNIEHDAHGNIQLSGTGALADLLTDAIKKRTSIRRVRGDTFGYLQRSFLGCVSEIDELEAREVGV